MLILQVHVKGQVWDQMQRDTTIKLYSFLYKEGQCSVVFTNSHHAPLSMGD